MLCAEFVIKNSESIKCDSKIYQSHCTFADESCEMIKVFSKHTRFYGTSKNMELGGIEAKRLKFCNFNKKLKILFLDIKKFSNFTL